MSSINKLFTKISIFETNIILHVQMDLNLINDCGKQGEELKKMIGAVSYIECSSKTQQVKKLQHFFFGFNFFSVSYF